MLLAGDEFGRTQNGNNNAYCQDNEITWLDWEGIGEDGARSGRVHAAADRAAPALPHAAAQPLPHRAYNEELDVKDVTWLSPAGEEMTQENWEDSHGRCLGVLLDGRAQPTGIRRGDDVDPADRHQCAHRGGPVQVAPAMGGNRWIRLIDTSEPEGEPLALRDFGQAYEVVSRSLLLFVLQPERTPQRTTAAECSFQRVVQAVEEAALKAVRFGFD